jgi:hypothetical protein
VKRRPQGLLVIVAEKPQNERKIDLDRQIRERLRRQNGIVTRQQLLALGVTAKAVDGRLRPGRYVAVYNGVYSEGVPREDPVGRATAAVLACGPDAVLSHGSAARLRGFDGRWAGGLEVTTKVRRTRPGITVHRCRSLEHRDITRHWAIPVTSPARTVLDVAPRLTKKALTRLVNDALRSCHLRPATLQDILERNPYHPGTKLLTPFAEDAGNSTNSDFEDDRERDAENLRHGLPTVRITKRRLSETPDREARRLHEILERS